MAELREQLIEYGKSLLRQRLLDPEGGWGKLPGGTASLVRARALLESPPSDHRLRPIVPALVNSASVTRAPLAPLHQAVWKPDSYAPHRLWEEFSDQCGRLPNGTGYLPSFVYLLSDYGARVSASRPELSVASHWRLVAALSCCFDRDPSEAVLLVGCDFAGLHEFMQVTAAKGAAKSLRGRSVYFQLLATVLSRALLRECGLPLCNLLTEGASKFLLLLPGNEADTFEAFRREVMKRSIELHGLELTPQLAAVCASAADLGDPGYKAVGQALHRRMIEASQRPLASLDQKFVAEVFSPIGLGTEKFCGCCRVDLTQDEAQRFQEQEDDDPEPRTWCAQCRSFGRTGQREDRGLAQELARARALWLRDLGGERKPTLITWPDAVRLAKSASGWWPGAATNRPTWRECLAYFGFGCELVEDLAGDRHADGERLLLNPPDIILPEVGSPDVSYGFRWLATATPWKQEDGRTKIIDTADMARRGVETSSESDAPAGICRYAVLAIDGDRMGDLYGACSSLQHALELGSAVSIFFEGWVDDLCRDQAGAAERNAYLLYAGGDDLLIVGSWNQLAKLACMVRRDYATFVNQGVAGAASIDDLASPATLSAGITLAPEHFPLYQAARAAHRALERAKTLEFAGRSEQKDCFDFLGVTVPWPLLPSVESFREQLVALIESSGEGKAGRRAILNKLGSVWREYDALRRSRGLAAGALFGGPWVWHLRYFLTRACRQLDEEEGKQLHEAVDRYIFRTETTAIGTTLPGITWLPLALRWADLLTRKTAKMED